MLHFIFIIDIVFNVIPEASPESNAIFRLFVTSRSDCLACTVNLIHQQRFELPWSGSESEVPAISIIVAKIPLL